MSFKYRNDSKFYKRLVVDGTRVNIPPGGIFESQRELDLDINDFLKHAEEAETITVQYNDDKKKKVEVVDQSQFAKLEKAILALHSKIPTKEDLKTYIQQILEDTPKIEQEELETLAIQLKELQESLTKNPNAQIAQKLEELDEHLKNKIDKRQLILKEAIDEVNNAVVSLEKYVYEGNWDNLPFVVVEDETDDTIKPKDTGPSIEDILKGN